MTGVHIISSSHSMFEKTIESECIFLKYFFFFFRRKLIFNFHLIFFQLFHYTFLYDSNFVLVFVRVLQQFFFPFSSFLCEFYYVRLTLVLKSFFFFLYINWHSHSLFLVVVSGSMYVCLYVLIFYSFTFYVQYSPCLKNYVILLFW